MSNGMKFNSMFSNCSSLKDIEALKKWNVSNGITLKNMLKNCPLLSNLGVLKNWNVPKEKLSNIF